MVRDVRRSGFHAATVLELVGQPGLDLQQSSPPTVGGFSPSRASLGDCVDGIDDDIDAEQEIGDSELVDDGVALDSHRQAGSAKGGFCRIHP